MNNVLHIVFSVLFCVFLYSFFPVTLHFFSSPALAQVYVATTTVSLTVCGDALVAPTELCDDGTNTGAYASSTILRHCNPICRAWGPYCGDSVVQVFYGEECDDGNNTAGDLCDAVCQNESEPVTEGGGGGNGGSGGGGGRGSSGGGEEGAVETGTIEYDGDTIVSIVGKAYPGATITVLRDGDIERVVEADSSANFSFTLNEQTPGITTFGFWALDNVGRRSVTYAATFQIVQNAITTLSGILIPPTIEVDPEKVSPGGLVSIQGSAFPQSEVYAFIDTQEQPEKTLAAANGDWAISYTTSDLSNEAFHTVKANYIDVKNSDLKSGYSLITNFYVGNNTPSTNVTADLNSDGKVNLTDFSIMLFHWNTQNTVADINKDTMVSLPDFSIMLFYWTG